MKTKALILTMFTALAIQAPIYACGKEKGVTRNDQKQDRTMKEKKQRRKKKLTQKLERIKRRLVALEKTDSK